MLKHMKNLYLPLIVLLISVVVMLSGCGGSSGGSSNQTPIQATPQQVTHVWNFVSKGRSPNVSNISMALTVTDTSVSGSATMVRGGKTYIGNITGTNKTSEADMTITWSQTLTWQIVMRFYKDSAGTIFAIADITENGTSIGSLTLVDSGPNTPPSIAGTYKGQWSATIGDTGGSATFVLTENGNTISGTYTLTNNAVASGTIASGSIIGNTLSLVLNTTGTSTVTCSASLNGGVYLADYTGSWGGINPDAGNFHVTKQ